MFEFIRNLGRSDKERQQETLNAYLDGELAPAERERFEQQLALDSDLQNELADMQFWQQQMRDLPARRVPRNFTLDPALYGRPQRQFLGSAYPALRTATALTAFLLVIALAANVYISSFSTDSAQPAAFAPALEMASEFEPAPTLEARVVTETKVEEEPPMEFDQAQGEMVVGEEAVMEEAMAVEAEVAVEEETVADQPAEQPAIVLESSIDKESAAAEAPLDIAEAEAPPADAVAEETAAEPLFGEQDEPLAEALRQELAQSLDIVEGTPEPPPAGAGEALSAPVDEATMAEDLVVEETLPATGLPNLDEKQSPDQLPTPADDTAPEVTYLLPLSLETVIFGLGLLFIFLTILTLIARGRR